jgi:transcriptional regulator with XRE-family HTH domain
MKRTALTEMRQTAPGRPKSKEIARRIGCSTNAVSRFECGKAMFGPLRLRKYARAIGRTVEEVLTAYKLAAISYYESSASELRQSLIVRGTREPIGQK